MTVSPLPVRLEAVIFDWAGTLVDHGSLAPTQIFVDAFATFGITLALDEARGPMGLSKRDHIRTLLEDPRLQASQQRGTEDTVPSPLPQANLRPEPPRAAFLAPRVVAEALPDRPRPRPSCGVARSRLARPCRGARRGSSDCRPLP